MKRLETEERGKLPDPVLAALFLDAVRRWLEEKEQGDA